MGGTKNIGTSLLQNYNMDVDPKPVAEFFPTKCHAQQTNTGILSESNSQRSLSESYQPLNPNSESPL
jgi:hypothetical protein